MDKLKILVCCHKTYDGIRTETPYFPIQVGKALHPELNLGYVNDNTGENISDKNPEWCEMTAIYWGWKNIKDVEYLGLAHYRRYFNVEINDNNIDRLMQDKDIMTVGSVYGLLKQMTYRWLLQATSQEDFYLFLDTLLCIHPDAEEAVTNYFYNNHHGFRPFTMFIARKTLYDEYCEFIFPVLFELEKRLRQHPYSRQRRAIAYFGEYSLGLFVIYKKLRCVEVPYVQGDTVYKPATMKTKLLTSITSKLTQLHPIKEIVVPEDVMVGFRNDGIKLSYLGK